VEASSSQRNSVLSAAGIILFDYLLAFGVIGLAGLFRNRFKDARVGLVLGITVTFLLRFVCHFITGVWIWEILWPNELGWAPAIWSLAYNASYMLPEMGITAAVAAVSFASLKKFWLGRT
jgi:thiamine transporter